MHREAQKSLLRRRNMFILTADTALKFADCPKFTKVSSTLAYCRNVSRTLAQDDDDDDEIVLCKAVLLLVCQVTPPACIYGWFLWDGRDIHINTQTHVTFILLTTNVFVSQVAHWNRPSILCSVPIFCLLLRNAQPTAIVFIHVFSSYDLVGSALHHRNNVGEDLLFPVCLALLFPNARHRVCCGLKRWPLSRYSLPCRPCTASTSSTRDLTFIQ